MLNYIKSSKENFFIEVLKITIQASFTLIIAMYTASYVTKNIDQQRLSNISTYNIQETSKSALALFYTIRTKPQEELISSKGHFPTNRFQKFNAQIQKDLSALMLYGTGDVRKIASTLFAKTIDTENKILKLQSSAISQSGNAKKAIVKLMYYILEEYVQTIAENSGIIIGLIGLDNDNAVRGCP